jgi:peptidoglycan/LPS O-acetylase OafA/YrhL
MPARSLGYQPALDGIRGLAIIGVLLLHGDLWGSVPDLVPGGHLGVTVFFVLSGFLITSLLLGEHRKHGRIDMRAFYLRRAARLLPGLLVLLPFHVLVWSHEQSAWQLVLTVVPAVLYLTSIVHAIWMSMGPISWSWSLSVEEHFYAGWPPLLRWLLDGANSTRPGLRGALRRHPLTMATTAALLLVAMATGLRLALVHSVRWHEFLYYSTFTRIDALAVGCLAALFAARFGAVALPRTLGWAALVVLGFCYLDPNFNIGSVALNVYGLPLTMAAAAVLILSVVGQPRGWLARMLSARWLVHLGAVSYGLYLWNLLPGQAWRMIFGTDAGVLGTIWCWCAMFIAVELSYHFVERPVMRWAKARMRGERVWPWTREEPVVTPEQLTGITAVEAVRRVQMDAHFTPGALLTRSAR